MILDDGEKRFELIVEGYEFPDAVLSDGNDTDPNWLIITVKVSGVGMAYAKTDACLLTWEAGWMAMWLSNVAADVPQSREYSGMVPYIEVRHILTQADAVMLRVRLSGLLSPPRQPKKHLDLFFTVPKAQVWNASASLREVLVLFPPRAGAEGKPPFVMQPLSRSFYITWILLVPAATQVEAVDLAEKYLRWIDLEPSSIACSPSEDESERWKVRVVTELSVPSNEGYHAVVEALSHLPMPYGAPRVGRPCLRPDGLLRFSGEIAPTRDDPDDEFSQVRGWFWLSNEERP